jgi:Prokaryotic E2 family E
MNLPPADIAYLAERELDYKLASEANMTCVVLPGYVLPDGYDRAQSDLLLRLSTGYPDVPPDMWWFDPGIRRADGLTVQATDHSEQHLGRSWQRWSRHFNAGQWQSGIDGLENFLALIRKELEQCASGPRQ